MWWWLGLGIERASERSLASLACSLQVAVGRNRRKGVKASDGSRWKAKWLNGADRKLKSCQAVLGTTNFRMPAAGAVPGAERKCPESCASERVEVELVN